jgi:RNA-directed DNA polymerase
MMQQNVISSVSATTKQETETYGHWSWVEASVWTKPMLAALDNGVKGGKWFSLWDKVYATATLQQAWKQVKRNKGSHGIDGVSVERFAARQEFYLQELHEALKEGRYQPLPVKRVWIPKTGGGKRPLGIPAVKDRIVQAALKKVIEPIFESQFVSSSYGFRPQRGCKDALWKVDKHLKMGQTWVVDADLKSYFDTISHTKLMLEVEKYISDGKVLNLIKAYLKQDIVNGLEQWTPITGTPQGAIISPLLANLYLHELDKTMMQAGYTMVRYADDFVMLCDSQDKAEQALVMIQQWVDDRELILHPDKTHIGNCMIKGQGFEFLGYRFETGKRFVRSKSMGALKDKIRKKTKRSCGDSMECIVKDLNPMLRGWFNYFKHANKWTFSGLDGFIRRRLRSLRCKQMKGYSCFGRTHWLHRQMPNTYFAKQGLFSLEEAHVMACQSRSGKS